MDKNAVPGIDDELNAEAIDSGYTYYDAIRMCPFVWAELLPCAETRGTYVDAISWLANRVGTLDADGMGEVALAPIALDLQTGLVHG